MNYKNKLQMLMDKFEQIHENGSGEIQTLIKSLVDIYDKKDHRLNKIIKLSDKQQMVIMKLNEELNVYKNHLERKVEEEIAKRKEQEEVLIEQSRLASMATMIDAVAHQWMQPLNVIKMKTYIHAIDAKKKQGVSPEEAELFQNEIYFQVDHMIETLNGFRSFFRPQQESTSFSVYKALEQTLKLIQSDLVKHTIRPELIIQEDFEIIGSIHEFTHIFINLVGNAKYAFEKNNIKEKKLTIVIDGNKGIVTVTDNAGGIDPSIINNLFEMHATTKGKEGTGMGLYLCQQIAYKHSGELLACNVDNGAQFIFQLKDNT